MQEVGPSRYARPLARQIAPVLAALAGLGLPATARAKAPSIRNSATVVTAVRSGSVFVGFDVASMPGSAPVASIRWSSGNRWIARSCSILGAEMRFSGLATPGTGTPRLGDRSEVRVRMVGTSAYPLVSFRLDIAAFSEARWRSGWRNLAPVYFLRCSLPASADAKQLMYQHGILYPGPQLDPYPITMWPMRGSWTTRWSYAPAMGAAPIPVVGLWSPASRLFAAYDFQEARATDRSDAYIASSYCGGLPDHPGQFISLSVPYAREWTSITFPKAPTTVASRFRLVYSRDMPDNSDPNRFVIRRILKENRGSLPLAPRMNDMSWLRQGKAASQIRFLHDLGLSPTYPTAGTKPTLFAPYESCEKPFFDPGVVQLVAHQTGKAARYMVSVNDRAAIRALKDDVDFLLPRATTVRFGDDVCTVWNHPLQGQFKDMFGGASATSTQHMFNWGIASAMLWLNKVDPDPRYQPILDGMVRWSRHYLYDRAGMADLPWAVFSMAAGNAGEYLIDYYYAYRSDPQRAALAREALSLAETITWRNTYWYTGDPIGTDTKDPSFLLQAVNSSYWLGRVTWGEMGRIPEMAIRIYLETGDPFWKYLVRGCLENYHIGTRSADGDYVENLDMFGESGVSGGWGGNDFRWLAEPLGGAALQVDVGPRAALAFCNGNTACDIRGYRTASDGSPTFTISVDSAIPGAPTGAFDCMVTSPHRSLTGSPILLNGRRLPMDRYVIGSDGVNAMVRSVRAGDVVTIGTPADGPALAMAPDLPVRGVWSPAPSADFHCVDLRKLANSTMDTRWSAPWGSYRPGPHIGAGVAWCLIDPELNRSVGGVSLNRTVSVLAPGGRGPVALLVGFARPITGRALRVVTTGSNGRSATADLRIEDGIEVMKGNEWYEKSWSVRLFSVGGMDTGVRAISITAGAAARDVGAVLLAVTEPRSATGSAAIAGVAQQAERRRLVAAYHSIQTPTRRAPAPPKAWHVPAAPWRFVVRLDPGPAPRTDAIVRIREDIALLLKQVGVSGTPSSVQADACIVGAGKSAVRLPAQFIPDDPSTPLRGEVVLRVPGTWSRVATVAVYLRPGRAPGGAATVTRSAGSVTVETGKTRWGIRLTGGGMGPRITELSFGGGPNLLARAGQDEGFYHLCACHDNVTWYDFGALQADDAHLEMVDDGPLATTVRISNLRLYGDGPGIPFSGVGTPGQRSAAVKGDAAWYLRFYRNDSRVDGWVRYRITDPGTGWTRPIDVRLATRDRRAGQDGGTPGEAGRWASQGGVAMVALDERVDRFNVNPSYTREDGAVLSALLMPAYTIGVFTSDRWRTLPAQAEARLAAEGTITGIDQYGLEVRSGGRILANVPAETTAVDEQDVSATWHEVLPFTNLAWLGAGRPDVTSGLRVFTNTDEGVSTRTEQSGSVVIGPGTSSRGSRQEYFYFDVDDARARSMGPGRAFVAIEYLDTSHAAVALQYDSTDPLVRKSEVPGAFKEATPVLNTGRTGQWKIHVFSVPDARFANNCNGADFRLSISGGVQYIRRVGVAWPDQDRR